MKKEKFTVIYKPKIIIIHLTPFFTTIMTVDDPIVLCTLSKFVLNV